MGKICAVAVVSLLNDKPVPTMGRQHLLQLGE